MKADNEQLSEQLSEDEIAMIVALNHGNEPSTEDPVAKALHERGLVQRKESSWALTPDGVAYLAKLR